MSSCFAMININEQSLLADIVDIILHADWLILGVKLFAKNVYFYVKSTSVIF